MRWNSRMKVLLPGRSHHTLRPELAPIVHQELIREEDCIVFSGQHGKRSDFPDSTGYECFANHVHIDDFLSQRKPECLVEQAFALASSLSTRLREIAVDFAFRFIVAANSDGCTLRFHTIRPGERWESENLELYANEAVAIIDSNDLLAGAEGMKFPLSE
jgi:hypothetical protein